MKPSLTSKMPTINHKGTFWSLTKEGRIGFSRLYFIQLILLAEVLRVIFIRKRKKDENI
jgi:hypothetical protein